jgi:hypothetical protein
MAATLETAIAGLEEAQGILTGKAKLADVTLDELAAVQQGLDRAADALDQVPDMEDPSALVQRARVIALDLKGMLAGLERDGQAKRDA